MMSKMENQSQAYKTKVLVVDDNVQFLGLLSEVLTSSGYEVVEASNGKEAQDKFPNFSPDIVVTDIVMPEIDGIELFLSLRKMNPDLRVVVMSGGNSGNAGSYLDMAEILGANVILKKPFELSELLLAFKKLEINM